jgi:hypothetical protein
MPVNAMVATRESMAVFVSGRETGARGELTSALARGVLRLALASSICLAPACFAVAQGVRVVDSVRVGVSADEAEHGLAGEEMAVGSSSGRTWRSAATRFSYTLRIYDDSPLTLVCVLADAGETGEAFDIVLNDRPVETVRRAPGTKSGEVPVTIPLAETAGQTAVTVTFRALAGSRTARLFELRALQEHLEQAVSPGSGPGRPM